MQHGSPMADQGAALNDLTEARCRNRAEDFAADMILEVAGHLLGRGGQSAIQRLQGLHLQRLACAWIVLSQHLGQARQKLNLVPDDPCFLSVERFDRWWRLNRSRQATQAIQHGHQLGKQKVEFSPEPMQGMPLRIHTQLNLCCGFEHSEGIDFG